MIVAIDGEAGSGKTTVASLVAERLGYPLLESGSIYRALGWKALAEGVDLTKEEALEELAAKSSILLKLETGGNHVVVDGEDVTAHLRTPEVSAAASAVAGFLKVRKQLLPLQRKAAEGGNLVAEGRDMGSVVFPDANLKFFLTASLEVRAQRRMEQLEKQGKKIPFEEVKKQVKERDERDAGRKYSPMLPKAAEDAVLIDTSGVDAESVVSIILDGIGKCCCE